ncbi:MAG: tripartite ATP-independent transporter DctM subunit [Verrucomicrobiales bacterium]|jgi:tripartite ATP-independent transporter DctM subunit
MDPHPYMAAGLFGTFLFFLFCGVHVAWAMGGSALLFTAICAASNVYGNTVFDLDFGTFSLVIERIFGLLESDTLVALPLFVLMGHLLDESGVGQRLMAASQQLMRHVKGGLAMSVTGIGILLAASTGIIGASVVLLGILSIPAMLQQGYRKELAAGTVCAAGTLGILIPPSIMLIVMADRLRVPAGDLFMGALLPGVLLGLLYLGYIAIYARIRPDAAPMAALDDDAPRSSLKQLGLAVLPTLALILCVLGSIFFGIATPTEASGLGAFGALLLALSGRQFSLKKFRKTLDSTLKTLGFLFAIFLGATCFALALRLLGGDALIKDTIAGLGLGPYGTVLVVLGLVFVLGFFLDWIEITIIVLPLVAEVVRDQVFPFAASNGGEQAPLIWFAILCAITLQTSFLTPPVGFAIFYVKGVCPPDVRLGHIYRGVIPFVLLQLVALALALVFPQLVLWLPKIAY